MAAIRTVIASRGLAAISRAGGFLLPNACPATGDMLETGGLLGPAAWAGMAFIDDPFCARCGRPFEIDYGAGVQCAACIASPPGFDRARAAVLYNEESHKLIVGFKHSDRTDLAPLFGRWLARAGAGLGVDRQTVLAPVPLHWRRLLARRYNQSALIAGRAAEGLGCEYRPDLLRRTRPTPPQKDKSADARRRNVQGAFAVKADHKTAIKGAHVILVDDVLTTGATLSACARALKRAGAARVDALVLARVVKQGAEAI